MRPDGRTPQALRTVHCSPGVNRYAEGSCLWSSGHTQVHCTTSVDDDVPRWRQASGLGWVTAEYRMLPRATHTRGKREGERLGGRTSEIQRLVGRSLRAAVREEALGPRMLTVDCDVLQADGGTRTASICGGFVALALALDDLSRKGALRGPPLTCRVVAVSVGVVDGVPVLDLAYEEDSRADVDFNVVLTDAGDLVEVQGTAERRAFSRAQLDAMVDLAASAVPALVAAQDAAVPGLASLVAR